MDRLDKAIADVAYILDVLMAYRNIVQTGNCNECKWKKTCAIKPELGQVVRYNCSFYEGEDSKQNADT